MAWTKVLTIMCLILIQLYVAEANDRSSSYIQEAQQQQIQLLQQQVVILQQQNNHMDRKMLEDSIQQRMIIKLLSDSAERRINDIELKNYKLERSVRHLNNRLNLNDNKNNTKVDMMLSDADISDHPIGDHVEERLNNLEVENIKLKQEIQHLKHVYRRNSNAGQHLPVVKDVASAKADNFGLQNLNFTLNKVLVDNKNLELQINTTLSEVLVDNKNIKLMLNKVKDELRLNTSDLSLGQQAMNHSLSKCLNEHNDMQQLISTIEAHMKTDNLIITFSAYAGAERTYTVGQTVIFDKVIINEGSLYYPQTSIFRCEHPGYYLFSLTILTGSSHSVKTELVVGGKAVTNVYDFYRRSASSTVVFLCERGDQVFVRCSQSGYVMGDSKNVYSSFTGTLLFPLSL